MEYFSWKKVWESTLGGLGLHSRPPLLKLTGKLGKGDSSQFLCSEAPSFPAKKDIKAKEKENSDRKMEDRKEKVTSVWAIIFLET